MSRGFCPAVNLLPGDQPPLAESIKLGGQPVARKVTAKIDREAERPTKLQHTNIVPVYSVRQTPPTPPDNTKYWMGSMAM